MPIRCSIVCMVKSTGMQRSARQLLGTGRAVVAAATGTTRRSATSSSTSHPYYNYILVSESTQRTYNGITNDLERRLRQHRGEAPGGAKSTRTAKDWTYLAVVGCPNWGPAAARGAGSGSPGGGSSAGGGHGSDNGGGGGSRGKAASGAAAAASFEARLRYPTGTRPRPARFAGPEGRLRGLCLVLQAQAEGQAEGQAEVEAAAVDTAAVRPAAARQAAAASSAPAAAGQSPGPVTEPSTPEHRPGPPQAGGGTGHTAVAPIAATVRKRRRSPATAGSLPTSTAPAPALAPAPAPAPASPNATMPSTIAVGALWTQPAAHVLPWAEAEPLQPTAVEQRAGGAAHACSDRQAAPGAWVWVHPRYRDCSAVAGCAVLRAAMAAAEALRGAGSSSNSNSSNDEDSSSKDGSGSGSRKSSRGRGAGAGSVGGDVRMAAALAALYALDERAAAELGQPRFR